MNASIERRLTRLEEARASLCDIVVISTADRFQVHIAEQRLGENADQFVARMHALRTQLESGDDE